MVSCGCVVGKSTSVICMCPGCTEYGLWVTGGVSASVMPRASVLLATLGANIKTGGFTRGFHGEMG